MYKLLLGVWLIFTLIPHALASERHALVVGNGDYKNGPLDNALNDASDMAVALEQVGFSVRHLENASRSELRRALFDFKEDLSDGAVGLFYYSGHGMQSKGQNYLIPVGADIRSDFEIEDEAIGVSRVLGAMEASNSGLNIVILDACRSNPFRSFFRSATRGFTIQHAPKGSLIAFATAPGQWAADGDGRNSPYTKYLLEAIKIPNLAIEHVFKQVRRQVYLETSGAQVPWEESSLMDDFYFSRDKPIDTELPLAAGPRAVSIQHTTVKLDSQLPGAVIVQVRLKNRRSIPQPYPLIQLTLSDRNGVILGRRIYTAHHYGARGVLGPNESSEIALHLSNPDENSVDFSARIVASVDEYLEDDDAGMELVSEAVAQGSYFSTCIRIGPFSTTDTFDRAAKSLITIGVGFSKNVISARELRNFRVYLGPFSTQAAREAAKVRLDQEGLLHYEYEFKEGTVLTVEGLSPDRENADKRVAELKQQGFDAKTRLEVRSLGPWQWLEVADYETTNDQTRRLRQIDWRDDKVRVEPIPCEY